MFNKNVFDVPTLVERMIEKPYMLEMGKGKLVKWFDLTTGEVSRAKTIARNKIRFGTEYHPKDVAFKKEIVKLPKILVFDIETSPSITYTFGRFNYNIAYNHVEQEPVMLTWSAKWLYTNEILSDRITPKEVLNQDDCRIVKSLWKLIDEADLVIAHYGDNFDLPFLNTRAVLNGLAPYTSVKSIDTKKVASAVFKFPSNKLDALGKYFNVGQKLPTDMSLWIACLKGDKKALNEMSTYNDQDVVLLEEVYLKLRPWIRSHPNVSIYLDLKEIVCACCGSKNVEKIEDKFYYTQTTKYPLYRCTECGGLTRGRRTVLDKEVSKVLGTSIPR